MDLRLQDNKRQLGMHPFIGTIKFIIIITTKQIRLHLQIHLSLLSMRFLKIF